MLFETFRRAYVAPHFGVPSLAWNDGIQGEGQDDVYLRKPSVVLVEDMVSRDDVTANSRKGGKQQCHAPLPPGAAACGIRRRLELSTEGFWDFLFSDRWPQTCLLRVLDGEVLENILVALYRLERDHDVISYVTLTLMEHERLIKPCSKTALPKDQFIRSQELVLVELDYWAPNRRLEASSLAENHTEDAGNNSWLTVVPDSRQPTEEADDKREDRAQYVASSASVRCNIRGLTRPPPHTDCLMPYHMIREPYLQRRQREGSVFPKIQLPKPRVGSEPTVDDLQESKKKGKEEKLAKEEMLQLGPRLEDGSEMVADDPLLQRLADEYFKQDVIVSKIRRSSVKLKSVGPTTNDQKKQPKKDGKESDSLTDEEADEKKGISWVEPERQKMIECDIRLMTKDLCLAQKNAGKKVCIRSKLHRELRRRKRTRISGISPSRSSSESDSEGGRSPAKPKPKSSDINCTKIKKWTKCPTFAEFYYLMLAEQQAAKESSEQDKRKGKKGKPQLSSPQKLSPKFPGGNESQRDGKGKANKTEQEIKWGEKDTTNESKVQEEEGQDQQTDKQSEEVKDQKAEEKQRKHKDKENQQRGRRDNRSKEGKRVMAMGLRDLPSQQVDITGARRSGSQIRNPRVPRGDHLRQRQRTNDKHGKGVEMVETASPRHTIQPTQYGKMEFTLPCPRPSNLTADKVREMARQGITLSGTHLLTPEQDELIREAGLIVNDDDPWHISVRFARLAGGVCDSIGVRNTLLWRRKRMLRHIDEGRLILKMHTSRLWSLVRIVPTAISRPKLQPPISPKLSAQDKGKSVRHREKERNKISTKTSATSPCSPQRLPISFIENLSLPKMETKKPLAQSKTDKTKPPRSPSTVMRTTTNEVSKLRDASPLAKERQPQKMKKDGSLKCEEKKRPSETLGKMKTDPQGGRSSELEDTSQRSDRYERGTMKSDRLGKNVSKRMNTNYVHETYRVMKDTAKEKSARQMKDRVIGTSEYFDGLTSRSKFDGDTSLCPTRSEGRKGAKSDSREPHVKTAKTEVSEISMSDLDNITEERLFELMKLNEVFEPTKLKSSYSFEKLFANRQDQIFNYSKLLSEFQKPFKGKVSKDIKKEKNDKAKKDEKGAEPEKQEAISTVIESDERQKEATAEATQSEPMVIGKLRKFKFLKYRDYISGTLDIGQPPRNHPTIEEICTMLERALHLFIVRKERATTTGLFQSKVSVTFSRRQPPDNSGRFLAAQTRDVVSNICNTLNL